MLSKSNNIDSSLSAKADSPSENTKVGRITVPENKHIKKPIVRFSPEQKKQMIEEVKSLIIDHRNGLPVHVPTLKEISINHKASEETIRKIINAGLAKTDYKYGSRLEDLNQIV